MPRLLRIAFPVALLLFAGFFFGGRLGWWSDDYWHCRRDTVTDRTLELVMHRGFFLRPLFYVVVPALTTALWHHAWAAHAVQLASHGLVVAMLWRLMIMLGVGRRAAGAAAMLFMVYPAQFEALFWVAALPTSMSSALMLGVMMLGVRIARGQLGLWVAPVMALMTFAACCLNEQPASVAGVLPVLAWAAMRRGAKASTPRARSEAGETRRRDGRSWTRLVAPGAVCVFAGFAYVAILRASLKDAPSGVRGSASSLVGLDKLWERTVYFADVLWRRLVMKNWGSGALREGWEHIRATGWAGWLVLGVVAALGVVWACHQARGPQAAAEDERDEPHSSARSGAAGGGASAAGALGLALFVVGWLPILAMAAYEPDSRCRYWPDVGLALLAAAAMDCAGARCRRSGLIAAARLSLVAALLAWSVMLIGVQSGFRNRWKLDRAEGAALKQLIPDPASFTMFIPLAVDERALETGSPVLDTHFRSVWEFPWSAMVSPGRVYQRDDLRCGYWRHWTPRVPVRGADESGIHYEDPNFGGPHFSALPDGTHLVPWVQAVPFMIGRDRVLRVVTRIVLVRAGEADLVIDVPQASGLPACEVKLPRL